LSVGGSKGVGDFVALQIEQLKLEKRNLELEALNYQRVYLFIVC